MMTRRNRIAGLAAIAAAALLVTSALAVPTYNAVTALDGSQNGWREAAIYGGGGSLTTYGQVGKGNPGPRPVGFYFMTCGQNISPAPGQSWIGTDKYHGVQLSQITTLKYWTIMDWRGGENEPLKDVYGNNVPQEWNPFKWFDKQPPQIELFCRVDNNTNSRQFIYRPWSIDGYPGYGPNDGSRMRKWEEWDCLTEGYWLEAIAGAPMLTWDEIKNKYPDAVLAMPQWTLTPTYGMPQCPVGDEFYCASFNIVLGARKTTNSDFNSDKGWNTWWKESWNAQGAVDKVIFGYDTGEGIVEDEYDFQSPLYATDASQNQIRALNHRALFDQVSYVPDPRSRPGIGTGAPPPWGGGSVDPTRMNAIQRAGNFNYDQLVIGRNPDGTPILGGTVGQLFVLYGRVSDSTVKQDWFKVDDGTGRVVDCYCQNAQYKVGDGDYVRMVGSCYGQNPYEWYYNMFHMVIWDADPQLATYSSLWPMQFHTFDWNVDVLAGP